LKFNRFAKYAWGVLAFNLLVVVWGAYVRATGSGAGCGSHWPLCDGQVIPQAPQIETIIEFTHRLTSGFAFLLVLGLFIWAFRVYPKGHTVRLGASLAMFFIITEALVGAGLVLFEWVAGNISVARVIVMAIHLINTHLLLASITLVAWWASGGERVRLKGQGADVWWWGSALGGVLLMSMAGAVTALGDTLFPASSLAEGFQQDFAPTAHFLIRLRVWHPVFAVLVGFYLLFVVLWLGTLRSDGNIKRFAVALIMFYTLQLSAGLLNLVLLVPVWMQLVHLFLADMVWISLVLLVATTLGESGAVSSSQEPLPAT